jgi:hypothetical protein
MSPYDITETPGGYYGIAYWVACMLFISVNKKKLSGIRLYLVEAAFLLLLCSYMMLNTNVPMAFFVPSMSVSILIMVIFIYLCCDFSLRNVGYFTARAFIVGEFTASFGWQIYFFAVQNFRVPMNSWFSALFLIIIYPIIFAIMFLMEKRFINENVNFEASRKEAVSAVIISSVVFMISNLSYVYENTPFSGRMTSDIFNVRTLVDFGGVALLFAYHMQIAELKMKFEVEKLQSLLNLQLANYQMSEKSIEMVNQKYHDLKHQIAVLKSESVSKESYDYLDQMEKEIKIYEAQNKTGNKILDTVITGKQLFCQSVDINLTAIAEGTALDFMDPIDISTLFGNVLDNAIESVSKLEDKEKRLIHLTVAKQKDFLRIRVENCYEGELVYKNGLPMTTKEDKDYHGYGLKSIQSTVHKYNGSVTIQAQNGWFEIRILIPMIDI